MSDDRQLFANLPGPLRALRHRNFRIYFGGQAISILGSWIQQVAMSWLVYRLTGSAELLGVTAFCALAPQLVVGPWAGAWIDRHDRRRLLMWVEGALAVQALGLALLTAMDWASSPILIGLALVLGVLSAIEMPLRQSLLNLMVGGREDLANAVALNASLFNIGRFVGPPIAGLLLGLTSEAWCFGLNGVSFAALILGLRVMPLEAGPRAGGSVGAVFAEGLRYARETFSIRVIVQTLVVVNITSAAYTVLLPVLAKHVFAGDAQTLGWLWGASGGGALAGTLYLASHRHPARLATTVCFGTGLTALALVVLALLPWLAPALMAMAALGFGLTCSNVGANTVLQTQTPDALRGRMISLFTSTRFGFDALGGLIGGLIAHRIGAPATLLGEGCVLSLYACWLLSRRKRLACAMSDRQSA